MSPAAEFLASCRSDRILAIHDECHAALRRASAGTYSTERVPEVAVASRHGKGAAREEHARPPDQSIRNSPRDTRIATPDVSYRGETAVEGVAQHLGSVAGDVRQRLRLYVRHLETGAQNMTVCVDQAGHQGLAADIHDVPAQRSTRHSVYPNDAVPLDNHNRLVEVLAAHA